MHDDYKQLDLSQIASAPPNANWTPLEPCPVCGSEAALWQYSESDTSPRKLLVACSHGDKIGPQDGLAYEGCPLYMPKDDFYRETIRDAVRFWNEFAKALSTMRRKNNWQHARVLRDAGEDDGLSAPTRIYDNGPNCAKTCADCSCGLDGGNPDLCGYYRPAGMEGKANGN